MPNVIPDTDNITVAKIAAAYAAVNITKHGNLPYTLEQWLEKFDTAYKAIEATIEGSDAVPKS